MANYWTDELSGAVESVTKGIRIINSDHGQHHLGNGYKGYIDLATLASSASLEYCLTTSENVYVHSKNWTIQAMDSSVKVEILTGATVSSNEGTAVSLSNTNNITTNTASTTIKASPTYTGGSTWHMFACFADSTNQVVGIGHATTSENDELVLKPDTEYIIKITNTGASTVSAGLVTIFFYEEEDGLIG